MTDRLRSQQRHSKLPRGSVVPGSDIWDDIDDDNVDVDDAVDAAGAERTQSPSPAIDDASIEAENNEAWLVDAQVVTHDSSAAMPADDNQVSGDPISGNPALDDPVFDGRDDEAIASRIARWGQTSAFGAGLYAAGLAIERIISPRDPVEIEIQNDTEDDEPDRPVSVHLDPDNPGEGVAVVRPWLQSQNRRPGADHSSGQ